MNSNLQIENVRGAMNCATTNAYFDNDRLLFRNGIITKTDLDYKTKSSYSVIITVSDGSLTDTINVTINVTDVATVSISLSTTVSPAIEEKLTLSLNITDSEAVAGYQATVQFDDTALRYISGAIGDYLPAGRSLWIQLWKEILSN